MQYRQLGASGLTVSVIGLGGNNFGGSPIYAPSGTVYGFMDLAQTRAVVDAAFDAGVNLFDTADVYGNGGSEAFLGQILKSRRHEVIFATKWGSGLADRPEVAWGSRRYIREAVEASLRRMETDYIDLYQMHWPDPRTPLEETLSALDELVGEGKVRYAGVSHFAGWQVADADWIARTRNLDRFIAVQNHYSLLNRAAEGELIPACERFGVGLMPYFPLENGLLTGKYRRDAPAPAGTRLAGREIEAATYDLLERLAAFAAARNLTMLDVALGGLAAAPVVGCIVTGATKAEQIRSNAQAVEWRPPAEDLQALRAILDSSAADAV